MYVPPHFEPEPATVTDLLRWHGAAELVTPTAAGLIATTLPLYAAPDVGEHGALFGHVARKNDHWRGASTGESLAILRDPDAYISPSWYAAKAEHGRVVPTWDYIVAHVHGTLVVHDDPAWTEAVVRRLTELNEAALEHPWSVDDAPPAYIEGQLRAIVGVELIISRIEAKAKLSQNRSSADIDGVIEGLVRAGDVRAAEAVRRARPT